MGATKLSQETNDILYNWHFSSSSAHKILHIAYFVIRNESNDEM